MRSLRCASRCAAMGFILRQHWAKISLERIPFGACRWNDWKRLFGSISPNPVTSRRTSTEGSCGDVAAFKQAHKSTNERTSCVSMRLLCKVEKEKVRACAYLSIGGGLKLPDRVGVRTFVPLLELVK